MNSNYMTGCKGQWQVSVFLIREFLFTLFWLLGSFCCVGCGLLREPCFADQICLWLKPTFMLGYWRGLCLRQHLGSLSLAPVTAVPSTEEIRTPCLTSQEAQILFCLHRILFFFFCCFALFLVVKFLVCYFQNTVL